MRVTHDRIDGEAYIYLKPRKTTKRANVSAKSAQKTAASFSILTKRDALSGSRFWIYPTFTRHYARRLRKCQPQPSFTRARAVRRVSRTKL